MRGGDPGEIFIVGTPSHVVGFVEGEGGTEGERSRLFGRGGRERGASFLGESVRLATWMVRLGGRSLGDGRRERIGRVGLSVAEGVAEEGEGEGTGTEEGLGRSREVTVRGAD